MASRVTIRKGGEAATLWRCCTYGGTVYEDEIRSAKGWENRVSR